MVLAGVEWSLSGARWGDTVSQTRVLAVWAVGEDRTVFDLSEALGDMSPDVVHQRIRALRRWGQVKLVGSVDSPKCRCPRSVYRRLW